jgi:autotransporter-associated beta strand protein
MKPRISNPFRYGISAIITVLTLGCFSASAATRTWDGGNVDTVSAGQWNVNTYANWDGSIVNGDDLVFGTTNANGWTLTSVGAARTIKSLTFQAGSPAYNIRLMSTPTGGTTQSLTFSNVNTGITVEAGDTSSHIIGSPGTAATGNVILQGNLAVAHNGTGTLTIDRPITGAGFGVTKAGTGTMKLLGANTYDGTTQVNGGILVIGNTAAKGSTSSITSAAAGTVGLGVGSTGYYTYADVVSLFNTNTLAGFNLDAASAVAIDTTNGNISSQSAALTGTRGLVMLGTIDLVTPSFTLVQFNVTNTYTGPTIIKGGYFNLGAGSSGGKLSTSSTITVEAGGEFGIFQNDTVVQGVDFSGAPITGGGGFNIVGSPTVTLNAANNYAGTTTIAGGLLKHEGSADLTLTPGNLIFDGTTTTSTPYNIYNGVLGLNADFTRALGTGDNQVQFTKSGGFAAFGADRTVSLNGGGNVQWGAGSFLPSSRGLILGHSTATHKVTFTNNINLATSGTRIIQVDNGSAAVDAAISGTVGISGGVTGGFVKTGDGTLELTNANLYTGVTNVSAGTLSLSHLSALGATSGVTLAGGTTLVPTIDGITISVPVTLGAVSTTSTINAPTLGASTNVNTLTLNGKISGAGNLKLNGSNSSNAYGTIVLGAANDYTGTTEFTCSASTAACFVKNGLANALPTTTVLTMNGGAGAGSGRTLQYDLNGFDQTLAGLTNVTGLTARNQQVTSSTPATLTVNNSGNYSFGGSVNFDFNGPKTSRARIEGAISLVKSGVGTFTLVEPHTYTGDTTVNAGILSIGGVNPSNNASTVTIAASGAKLKLDYAGSDTVNKLFIGATQQAAGTYGHTSSGATNGGAGVGALDAYFEAGTGTLTVTSGPVVGGLRQLAGRQPHGPNGGPRPRPRRRFQRRGVLHRRQHQHHRLHPAANGQHGRRSQRHLDQGRHLHRQLRCRICGGNFRHAHRPLGHGTQSRPHHQLPLGKRGEIHIPNTARHQKLRAPQGHSLRPSGLVL